MARLNDLGNGKMEAPKLRPEIIKKKPNHNYRDMTTSAVREYINWLKDSIRSIGVQKPISVSYINGEVFLEAGECRLTACQELRTEGWDGWIPAFPVKGDEAKVYAQGLLDNGGMPPTKLEFGKAVDKLLAWGWTPEDILPYVPAYLNLKGSQAKRYITEAAELHNAPIAVKKAVSEGVDGVKFSESAALAIARNDRLHADQAVQKAVKDAKAQGKTVVTRPKEESAKDKTGKTLFQLARKLLKGITQADLCNEDVEYVSVDRKTLQELYLTVNNPKAGA